MNVHRQSVSEKSAWPQLIRCARQPGSLRISRRACGLRYLEAQRMSHEVPRNDFEIVRSLGLEICRTCPLGEDNAKALSQCGPSRRN